MSPGGYACFFFSKSSQGSAHLVLWLLLLEEEVAEDVHGHGEDDGGVLLRRNAVQRLQVAQLERLEKEKKKPIIILQHVIHLRAAC